MNKEREPLKKLYATKEVFDDGVHYYEVAYCPTREIDKEIRFSYIEHYLQFVDLLHEAGYKYFDDTLRAYGGVEDIRSLNLDYLDGKYG